MKKKGLLILMFSLIATVLLLGGTYAFFTYYRVSDEVSQLLTGEIYLNYQEGENVIDLDNAFPESAEKARTRTDNYATFTITGRNTSTNKDIWYEVKLLYGNNLDGMTRINDSDLRFDLIETTGGEKNYIFEDASFDNLNNEVIWINRVNRNTASNIERTYQLRMWLSEDISVSDTDINADYTTQEFKNLFANVKVAVYGDLKEKYMYSVLEEKLEDNLTANDGTARYVTGNVGNNYVWYSGKLWMIVSLNNDNTIKLVTQGNMTTISLNTTNTNTVYENSLIHNWLKNEFLPTLEPSVLAASTWDYTTYALGTATKAPPSAYVENEKVGLLTIYDFYKVGTGSSSFLNNGYDWWTMSPKTDGSRVWYVDRYGAAKDGSPASGATGVRPSVNLKSDIQIMGGVGTKSNPYVIGGDKDTGVTSELLSNRISGEYINFNDALYRIVGTEEIAGQKLTKITMADYSLNKNTLTTSLAFGADASQRIYSPTYGIGLYLEEWYQADSTSETYATTYIKDNYKVMIATSGEDGDNVVWYTGPTSGIGYDYTLSKTGTPVSATIGLGYYGEMFSCQFGDGYNSSTHTWLMTINSSSYVWNVFNNGSSGYGGPTLSSGVRPSLYLKSTVKIGDVDGDGRVGDGTKERPYEIVME